MNLRSIESARPSFLRSLPAIVSIALVSLSHLAVIPILSLYGVRICPVLQGLGFRFGCLTQTGFIASVMGLNFVFHGTYYLGTKKSAHRAFPAISLFLYALAYTISVLSLVRFLEARDVPGPSLERMQNALAITGILLGVFQARLVDLLWTRWMRGASLPTRTSASKKFLASWLRSKLWQALPLLGALAIETLVLSQKLRGISEDGLSDQEFQTLVLEVGKITALLAVWLAALSAIQFFKDSSAVFEIQAHLKAIEGLDTEFRSSESAAGSWSAIFSSLNQTSITLGERTRLIEGFSRYVARSVVDDVLKDRELTSTGESVDLFILMADLRDFTRIANTLKPDEVVHLLNTYLNDMIPVLTRNGLVLDKFIGDGILAYLDPRSLKVPTHAADCAARAAFEMHEALLETNRKLKARSLPQLALGNAVHFGSVVLGNIGSVEKLQHTIIGDAVNTAARLEALCKEFSCGIVIGESVASQLSTDFLQDPSTSLHEEAPQTIRGLAKSIRVFSGKRQKQPLKIAA